MLNVYQSNRLEALVTILCSQLSQPLGENPLAPEVVLVQSPGMSQWLKIQIAEQNGIAANLNFPLPSSFIWRLYQDILKDVPELSPFNKDRMTWKLFHLLPNHLDEPEFLELHHYLALDDESLPTPEPALELSKAGKSRLHTQMELRRYHLAEKIADVYDNYLMYRPHWLEHWQAGNNDLPDEAHSQPWQAILWRSLLTYSLDNNVDILPDSPLHRADMQHQLLTALTQTDSEKIRAILPSRLFVFGIASMPRNQLILLQAISQHIPVDMLWMNPSAMYWGDIVSDKTLARLKQKDRNRLESQKGGEADYFICGNPILANLGKVGRDYLELLHNQDIELTDIFIDQPLRITRGTISSALHCLQQDILNLEFRGASRPLTPLELNSDYGKRPWVEDDDSIRVHACHSAMRELEVLKDRLLAWFEQDSELTPKDVLVMMPDINHYAPFIESVFGTGDTQSTDYIPYTIADRSAMEQHPVLKTFVELLGLSTSRFTVTELLDILEVPEIAARFGLDEQAVSLIKIWIGECQIKWGRDAKDKTQWQLPAESLNTWVYGLRRMLLGVALEQDELWQEVLAYPKVEGLNAEVLGRLLNYFSFLSELKDTLELERDLKGWHDFIAELIHTLFDDEQTAEAQISPFVLQALRRANETLLQYREKGDYLGPAASNLIQRFFKGALEEGGVAQRFLAGKMNFCTLMPMRSVPFKVIAILGLNEQDYPRQVDPISFDLVSLAPARKGDRNRKLDDRYLFLEALISVREKLHLSYIGQSVKTNQAMVPSVVLDELMEYLQSSFIVDNPKSGADLKDHFLIAHPLQPFDKAYFQTLTAPTELFTYNTNWLKVLQSKAMQEQAAGERKQALGPGQAPNTHERAEAGSLLKKQSGSEQGSAAGSEVDRFLAGMDPQDPLVVNPLDLTELLAFWRHPLAFYYKRVLDIDYDLRSQTISEHESFQHDGLQQYQFSSALLQAQLHRDPKPVERLLRSGEYPSQLWGQALLNTYVERNGKMERALRALCQRADDETLTTTAEPISLLLEQHSVKLQLEGALELIAGKNIEIRNGKLRPVDKLTCWLRHLIFCAAHRKTDSLVLTNDDKALYFAPLSKEDAIEELWQWLLPFLQTKALGEPVFWHIAPADAWFESTCKGEADWQQQRALIKTVQADGFSRTLADDEYASRHFSSLDDFSPSFFEMTERLLSNMQALAMVGKPVKIASLLAESRQDQAKIEDSDKSQKGESVK